ncbi:MAG: DUF190 domain-containing protein [Chloroflexota bacterium]|nr:DUF190 domain-containing protein [Chloroflexota bacterium]
MTLMGPGQRLTIYIGDSDQWQGRPLYRALLETLRSDGLAGATVVKALAGFGAHSRVHTASLLRLSTDLSLVITVVDQPERIQQALLVVGPMVVEGLITVENVQIVQYRHRGSPELPRDRLVRAVMSRSVATVMPDTPIDEVVRLLLQREVKAVPVVSRDWRVVGIITGGDLLERGGMSLRLSIHRDLTTEELADQLKALQESGKTAGDIMSPGPVTIGENATLDQAGRIMAAKELKRLPVEDETGKLVGIISRFDLLQVLAADGIEIAETAPRQLLSGKSRATAGEVASQDVPTGHADTPLQQVLDELVASSHRRVVITDDTGRVVGLVTDRALLESIEPEARQGVMQRLAARLPWSKSRAGVFPADSIAADVMVTEVYSVLDSASLAELLREMLERGVKRLLVLDAEGRMVGLAERKAVMKALYSAESCC